MSSLQDADSASTSPSPSTSIAKTDMAANAVVATARAAKDWDTRME